MPLYITQNIGPKIGLANGSTGFVVGFQFPERTVFKETSVMGATMKIATVLPEIVYVSVDQAKLKSRFPGVPEIYLANTLPIPPYTVAAQVKIKFSRSFTINVTQIPISPSFAATAHKLQGITSNSIFIPYQRACKTVHIALCTSFSCENIKEAFLVSEAHR